MMTLCRDLHLLPSKKHHFKPGMGIRTARFPLDPHLGRRLSSRTSHVNTRGSGDEFHQRKDLVFAP
jgi:hypothetical protein